MHHTNRFGSDRGDASSSSISAKRPFDQVENNDRQALPRQRQRLPALSSVVLEAVKMDNLQKLCSSLEPIIRKVVGEELERALANLIPNGLEPRASTGQIQGSTDSDLCLYFTRKLALPLFTGGKVEGEGSLPVHIVLKNDSTKQVVSSGHLASAKLEVVVLDGDFANEDDDWTAEDFEKFVVKERDGKRPLLAGDLNVSLKEGTATLGELTFTDNSSWIRSRKFRLGVRVVRGFAEGIRIKECKTEAFIVKDHRGELYKKHYPPCLNDDVWRLDKIGKDGAFHKRLQEQNVKTVEDFLRLYMMDQHKLRNTLGSGMSNKMWDAAIEHAKTCILNGKLYVYYTESVGVIFNNIYELLGVTSNNVYKSAELLDEYEKVHVDKLVKLAYENWSRMIEYENGSLGNEISSNHLLGPSEIENNRATHELTGIFNQSMSLPQQPGQLQGMSSPTAIIPVTSRTPAIYDYGSENALVYTNQGNEMIQNDQIFNQIMDPHSQASAISIHSFLTNGGHGNPGVARGTSQAVLSKSFSDYATPVSQPVFQAPSVDWQRYTPQTPAEYYVNEDDIRTQTVLLLNNEEMQQQLRRMPYFPRPENAQSQGEDAYLQGFTPSAAYGEDRVRHSPKAYVGWLKLKAALRWGIFIRKIAANRVTQRARLEELED